uniref:Uncharacterized protein n=1 Tax=Fagus sylvatica TaxID=28930 RepID=A0A2N9H6M0_FAGSY
MIGVGIEAFDGALDDVSEDGVSTPVDGVIGGRGRVVVAVVEGRAGNLREGVRREWGCKIIFGFYGVGCVVFPWVDKVCLGWVSMGFAVGGRRQRRSLPSAWV